MQFAGSIIQGASGKIQEVGGFAASAGQAKQSARDLERQADIVRFQTRFEARQEKKRSERIIAKNVANVAAGNVDVSSGTPLEQELSNVKEAELQRLDIVHRGKVEEQRLRRGAARAKAEAIANVAEIFMPEVGGNIVRGASGFFGD